MALIVDGLGVQPGRVPEGSPEVVAQHLRLLLQLPLLQLLHLLLVEFLVLNILLIHYSNIIYFQDILKIFFVIYGTI